MPSPLIAALAVLAILFSGCAVPQRTGYDRNANGYKAKSAATAPKKSTTTQANRVSTPNRNSTSSLHKHIEPWLGTPYAFSGSTKSGTDCSGFVMNIFREWKGISLPHSTRDTWDFGTSVSKGSLREGDVVFFGTWLGVNHNGIYLGDGTFAHASSSKGVIITPMNDPYWAGRYKGARRY